MNAKHKAFLDHYLKDPTRNPSAAYLKVYPKVKQSTADANASRLLKNAKIREFIRKFEDRVTEKVEITTEMILNEYKKLAFFDIRKLYNEDGTLKEITELDDDSASVVAGMDVSVLFDKNDKTPALLKKIKLSDRKAALDSLARIKGMFIDKIETKDTTFEEFLKQRYANKRNQQS